MIKTPFETLDALATALYGRDWINSVARDCDVSRFQVLRWKDGRTPLHLDNRVFAELRMVMKRKARGLARLSLVLDAIVARNPTRDARAKRPLKASRPDAPAPAAPVPTPESS